MKSFKNTLSKILGSVFGVAVAGAILVLIGVGIAAWFNHTEFSAEFMNMIAWFKSLTK